MELSEHDVKALVLEMESDTLEFKRRLPPDTLVAGLFAAFANSKGGTLLVGVDDESDIIGLSEGEANVAEDRLRDIASSLLPTKASIGTVVVDGRRIVYSVVSPAPDWAKPIATSRGGVYARHDDTNVRLPRRTVQPHDTTREMVVFVAMSFHEEEEPALVDYWRAMCRAGEAAALPLKLCRVDLSEGDFEISQRIMTEIERANVVIADFTLSSPNVYFEMGYARGLRKRLIQTARKGTSLAFDVRNWRTIFYKNATELEEKLIPALQIAYAEFASAG